MLIRLLAITFLLSGPVQAAEEVTGQGSLFGGQLDNDGSQATAVGVEGAVLIRFTDTFGFQADAQIARFATRDVAANQLNLNAPASTVSATTFSSKFRAVYLDSGFAVAVGGGFGDVGSRSNFNGGLEGAVFFDRFTLRGEASFRGGEREYTNVALGTIGIDYFPYDNLALSLDGSYGEVISTASNNLIGNPLQEEDSIFMASASVDYRFDSSPLGLGVAYGFLTTSPDRGGDVHIVAGRATVYFGSESIKDSRQRGAVFGRSFRLPEVFLDGLL